MRYPTFSEFLFSFSMVFLIAFLWAFNSELKGGKPFCEFDLLNEKQDICNLSDNAFTNFRLVVYTVGRSKTETTEVLISVTIVTKDETIKHENILSKAARTGAGVRYHNILNYGVYDIPKGPISISIIANDHVNRYSSFEARLLGNASDNYVYFMALMFLVILFFSIYNRKKIFAKGIGKPLPYVLYFLVALSVLSWAW